jgi:hypothetical protein
MRVEARQLEVGRVIARPKSTPEHREALIELERLTKALDELLAFDVSVRQRSSSSV